MKVQTTVSWPTLAQWQPLLLAASALAAAAAHKHYANQRQEFSQNRDENSPNWKDKCIPCVLCAAGSPRRQPFVAFNGGIQMFNGGCHMSLHGMAQPCFSSSLDMRSRRSQRSHLWTMEWCAASHIPLGSFEVSSASAPRKWVRLHNDCRTFTYINK